MPQGPDLRQYLDQALQLGTLTRAQAQKITKDLVREGQLAQERAQTYVDELVERSRRRTEGVVALIREEVKSQIASLGIATKEDIARLEKRIAQSTSTAATSTAATSTAATSTAAAPATKPSTTSAPGPELPLGGPAAKSPAKKGAKKATKKKAAK